MILTSPASGEVFYYFTSYNQSGGSWNKRIAGRDRTPFFIHQRLNRHHGFFFAIDHLQVFDAFLTEFLAQNLCQRVYGSLRQVGYTKCCSVYLVGGTHRRNEWNLLVVQTL